MNKKNIIRLVLTALVAIFGAWQLQQGQKTPPNESTSSSQSARKDRQQQSGGQSERSNQTGDFDYYLISLSWSPSYCLTRPDDKRQCGGRGYGFVLHGLWPQKSGGGWPEDCPATTRPSAAMIQKTLAFMPSEKLINHEWKKHGTCSGLSADEYLGLSDKAFASIKIPAAFAAPDSPRNVSADQVVNEFSAANPNIPKDSFVVSCSKGELSEVRVCVDSQLKGTRCGKGVRTQCRDTARVLPTR